MRIGDAFPLKAEQYGQHSVSFCRGGGVSLLCKRPFQAWMGDFTRVYPPHRLRRSFLHTAAPSRGSYTHMHFLLFDACDEHAVNTLPILLVNSWVRCFTSALGFGSMHLGMYRWWPVPSPLAGQRPCRTGAQQMMLEEHCRRCSIGLSQFGSIHPNQVRRLLGSRMISTPRD